MPRTVVSIFVVTGLGLSACASTGGGDNSESGAVDAVATESEATTTTITNTTTALVSESSAPEEQESVNENKDKTMATEESEPVCTRLTDFSSDADSQEWLVVNDDVMGGRSLGGMSFENNTMIFAGEVNTNGGGFASLRLPLEAGTLADFSKVAIRARPDERTYVITFDDNLPARNRRVSHRAPIPFSSPGEWQTITVPFDDLFPAIFGQPIDDLPFRPDLAVRMGLMISDGLDGPFSLEVDWIDLCP